MRTLVRTRALWSLGVLLLLAVWAAAPAAAATDPTDPAQPIQVAAGDHFTVILESNPSTGYSWELAQPLDARYLQLVNQAYEAPPPGPNPVVGAPGQEVWTFAALAPGQAQIVLRYRPPGTGNPAPAQTRTFTVVVGSGSTPGMPRTGQPAPWLLLALAGLGIAATGYGVRRLHPTALR